MKLSFSISSKPSSNQHRNLKPSHKFNSGEQDLSTAARAPSISPSKEDVTEFDASKTLTQQPKKLVIPPKPNEWRPYKKMKNLDLPLQPSDAPDLRFEFASTPAAEDGSNISYGLNLRNPDADPMNVESASLDTVLLQKLRDDLNRLPEDIGEDEYAVMPVEGFGAALLAGYGWHEGMGIGRNAKEDVKIVEYKRRNAKEGLGFFSDMASNSVNNGSNGSKKKEKEQSHRGQGEDGGWFSVGKDVRIIVGRDVGLKGRIVKVVGGHDSVVLKLSRSKEELKVRIRDIARLGSVEEERCLRKLKELKATLSKDEKHSSNRHNGRETMEDGTGERRKITSGVEKKEGMNKELSNSNQVPWLTSHIRVRIISKELKGGRLYLKKGEVVDVVGPTTCDISMDESRELIQGVDQDLLETALPRRGRPVLVLYGKHKGTYGSLVERNMENETGVVRDADTHALLNVRLEQIAEYIGDPSYIGY